MVCGILHSFCAEWPSIPKLPSGVVGQQLQQYRHMANALVVGGVQLLANALGKCQFVVDTMWLSNILRHGFPFTFLHKYHNQ